MSTETIVVQVSPEMATAYREASKQDRQKLDLLVNLRLKMCLKLGGLSEVAMEKMSQEAITETIVVHVNSDVATAYREASGWTRRKLDWSATSQLVEHFESRGSLEGVMDAMSREAAANGLTPDVLDSILNSEPLHADDDAPIPISLKIVAAFFILSGVSSALEILVDLMHNHINFNFGVLGLFVGGGLLRLSRGWRTCGLVFLWIGIILCPIVVAISILASRLPDVTVFGQKAGTVPMDIALVCAAVAYALILWQYHVLTRPDIRKLFGICDFCSSRDLKWIKR